VKKKNLLNILFIFLLVLISLVSIYGWIKNSFIFELLGDKEININVNEKYEESGYKVVFLGSDYTHNVEVENNVNFNKIGEYEVKYRFKNWFVDKTIVRKVIVKDNEAPVISLNGNNKITIKVGENYTEPGVNALDNYDGDITTSVKIEGSVNTEKTGDYEIVYKVVDSSGNETSITRTVIVEEKYTGGYGIIVPGPTYINGILIVNKKYSLPSTYGGTDSTALSALKELQSAGQKEGFSLQLVSGYRSYETQKRIYNNYVNRWGIEYTDTTSARPGHSEHQTGLAFDVGELTSNYGETKEGIWLKNNCYKYGFIIRYLKGKENITGYSYEPWHIRYVGVEVATEIMQKNITLEEYLGV